MLDNLFH